MFVSIYFVMSLEVTIMSISGQIHVNSHVIVLAMSCPIKNNVILNQLFILIRCHMRPVRKVSNFLPKNLNSFSAKFHFR